MSINTVISTNIIALNTSRNLNSINSKKSQCVSRLSSGLKINTAAEDAAGATISQKLKAQIRGLNTAAKNSEDAISLVETFESAYGEVQDMLQRCREITVQAANDTNTREDRVKLMTEVSELLEEVEEMLDRTQFNGKDITELSGSMFQVGANTSQFLEFSITDEFSLIIRDYTIEEQIKDDFENIVVPTISNLLDINIDGRTEGSVGTTVKINDLVNGEKVYKLANVSSYIDAINESIDNIDAYLYDDLNTMKATLKEAIAEAVEQATAAVLADWTKNRYEKYKESGYTVQIISNGDEALLQTSYSDANGNNLERINDVMNSEGVVIITDPQLKKVIVPGITAAIEEFINGYSELGGDIFLISLKDHVDAFIDGHIENQQQALNLYLNSFDELIDKVSDIRSELGSFENRLRYTINNLEISSENLSSANSLLEDADMAKEIMNLTKVNVLTDAATLLLAQSNSSKESILDLLS